MTTNGFYDASTDPAVVKQLFELAGDDCLIGARMGAESGLFACDFDIYKAGEAGASAQRYMAQLIAGGLLPDTQRHKTMNGGLHLIYQSKYGFPNCKPADGVEIKGEGGYIILPPSRGYLIEDDAGFRDAPKALVEALVRAKRQHTDKTVDQHEASIIAGKDFHDSITSIVAKMFRRGRTPAEIMARVKAALEASVASNPSHPRHERWKALMEDSGEEVSRIINSGRTKYDQRAKTEHARDQADAATIDRIRKIAEAAGFSTGPDNDGSSTSEEAKKPSADDYAGEWPFSGEGYFAHEPLNVADQRFNLFPIYAENESVVIAADPKAGKTAISLKLAVQVASGRSLGPFKVTDPRGVLYFALEGTRAIKLRLEAEKRYQKEQGNELPENLPLFVVERPTNFITKSEENVAKVVAASRYFTEQLHCPLGIVVIDTLTKAMPGSDQNSVDDTSALFDFTTQLRANGVTATVVFIHHTGKDGKTRGSSNIEAEVDVVLKMRKQEDGSTMMYVHMARSIDDNNLYRFNLESYNLGETEQGIMQSAPIVTLSEGSVAEDVSTKDAVRAQRIVPFLKAIVALGGGVYTIQRLYEDWRSKGLLEGRQRKKAVTDVLEIIFDREVAVTFQGHIVSLQSDTHGYSTVTVREPGVQ
jgi:KaiC/GvpD/RAD55 family RecA-like ATPase